MMLTLSVVTGQTCKYDLGENKTHVK